MHWKASQPTPEDGKNKLLSPNVTERGERGRGWGCGEKGEGGGTGGWGRGGGGVVTGL